MDKFDVAHGFTARWLEDKTHSSNNEGCYSQFGISINFLVAFSRNRDNYKWLCDNGFHPLPINRSTIRNMTSMQARGVFMREYWDYLEIEDLPVQMACILYDTALTFDKNIAVRIMQRGYNKCIMYGVKLDVIGKMNHETKKALRTTNTSTVWEHIIDERKAVGLKITQQYPRYADMADTWDKRANALHTLVENL